MLSGSRTEVHQVAAYPVLVQRRPNHLIIRAYQDHLMRGKHIAPESEVIRAIVSGYSPCVSSAARITSRDRSVVFESMPIT